MSVRHTGQYGVDKWYVQLSEIHKEEIQACMDTDKETDREQGVPGAVHGDWWKRRIHDCSGRWSAVARGVVARGKNRKPADSTFSEKKIS